MPEELKRGLSLSLIVGPGEAFELKRCLRSCIGTINGKPELFDEINVTFASNKEDEEVCAVAEEYATKLTKFNWIDDFSAARNYNFNQSEMSHILWLDADDVIKPEDYDLILSRKDKIYDLDMILISYVYAHDNDDKPVIVLPRERIVRNTEGIRWEDPIHEFLPMIVSNKMENWSDVKVDHYRMKPFNPERNISILSEQYKKPTCTARNKFYYGKELFDVQRYDEALPILEEYVKEGTDFRDNLTVACIKLATYYYVNKNKEASKNFALRGIRFNSDYAENYVIVGDILAESGMLDDAIRYYQEAKGKSLTGGMSQLVDYYGFIPAYRLAIMYSNKNEYKTAKKHAEEALSIKPNNQDLKRLLGELEKRIQLSEKEKILDDTFVDKLKSFLEDHNFSMLLEDNNAHFGRMKLVVKKKLAIAWMLPGINPVDPATRIRRLQLNKFFNDNAIGVKSHIVTGYLSLSPYEVRNKIGDSTVAVFTTFSDKDKEVISYLRSVGIRIIYDIAEAIFDLPGVTECLRLADQIVCCSDKLSEMCRQRNFSNVVTIKDAVEKWEPVKEHESIEKPKALYMGMGGNSFLVTDFLRDTIEESGYDLEVITEWDNATKKWSPEEWPQDMISCDVVLCPQRVDVQPAKSDVKASVAMALGMPVIASKLPSYVDIIKNGENGFLCESKEDWKKALTALRNVSMRKMVGDAARNSVVDHKIDVIAEEWKKAITDTLNVESNIQPEQQAPKENIREIVDIIIPNYQNVEYLKMCLTSIRMNTIYPYHIIISDAGSNEETWEYLRTLKGITIVGAPSERKTYSESCNAGIEVSSSRFFIIINSDVIVSKNWITNLMDKMTSIDRLAACGVLSNCDRGWLHNVPGRDDIPKYPMKLEKAGLELVPGMKIEQLQPHVEELYQFMDASNKQHKGRFTPQSWVAGYATIYARTAINEVGLFDPRYKNGCEDSDLCYRLQKSGYAMGQAIDSFVFHFGGVSRGAYQEEGREEYDKEDKENHIKIRTKWAKEKIAIYTGPAWEPWDKEKVDAGMAGSETWAVYLAEAFVRKGYEVRVYNDLTGDKKIPKVEPVYLPDGRNVAGGVIYRDHSQMMDDLKYEHIDHFICSRTVAPFYENLHSGRNYVMIHDVWLSQDPNYDLISWKIQKYAYLSEWHKQFLLQHHKNMPAEKMFLTANGVVQDWYADVDNFEKKNMSVYSSSPDRGLYQLLQMVPKIRERVEDFELNVSYGFHNWESSTKARNDVASMQLIDKIKGLMEQPGVNYLGRVSKKELAELQKQAKVWLYPNWFAETFCCGGVENGLSKNALLTTDLAGLKTTAKDAAIMLSPYGLSRDNEYPKEYVENFVNKAVELLKNEELRKEWADRAYNKMQEYTWDKIADGWVTQFKD